MDLNPVELKARNDQLERENTALKAELQELKRQLDGLKGQRFGRKFCHHLPLYRQHQRLAMSGITVSRSTLTQLVQRADI